MKNKFLRAAIALLLTCDVSLIFAAQSQNNNELSTQEQQQLQQLQQFAQQGDERLAAAQSRALSEVTTSTTTPFVVPRRVRQTNASSKVLPSIPVGNRRSSTKKILTPSTEEIVDGAAFRKMQETILPMSPEQIIKLKKRSQATDLASATNPGTPPKPVITSQFVNLAPGATPPIARLSYGFISSLVFVDSTGAPWPIAAYSLGNPKAFNIQWNKKSNTLTVQALEHYISGNLAVWLKDLSTPIMLTLIPGQKQVDYRRDYRVHGYGPNAKQTPSQDTLPGGPDPVLLSVLDGVPPPQSHKLTVQGGRAKAWLKGTQIYLRTRATVLSPGWIASMTSADGMHVYQMQSTSLLLVSSHGKVIKFRIQGL
jgi:intracellular multiplication protein IcmK